MNATIAGILGYSKAIGCLISLVRLKKIHQAYYPFLYLLWIGVINETISFAILIPQKQSTAFNNNIYVLIESLLIAWQFKNWGAFDRAKPLFPAALCLFTLAWIAENFYISDIRHFAFYFRIFYSIVIVLLSINIINEIIATEKKDMLKNAVFLICVGFVLYFSIRVLVQSFWLYGLNRSLKFAQNVVTIHIYINFLVNLIYALAVLWMPTRQRFSMPS